MRLREALSTEVTHSCKESRSLAFADEPPVVLLLDMMDFTILPADGWTVTAITVTRAIRILIHALPMSSARFPFRLECCYFVDFAGVSKNGLQTSSGLSEPLPHVSRVGRNSGEAGEGPMRRESD